MAGPRGATSTRLAAVASEQRSKVRGHELPRKLELGEGGAATGALLFGHCAVRQHLVPYAAEVARQHLLDVGRP